jgi:hypothetical protein
VGVVAGALSAAAADEWRIALSRVAVPLGLGQCCKVCQLQVLWRFWDDADSESGLRHNLAREERANVGIAATVMSWFDKCCIGVRLSDLLSRSPLQTAAQGVRQGRQSSRGSWLRTMPLMPNVQPDRQGGDLT